MDSWIVIRVATLVVVALYTYYLLKLKRDDGKSKEKEKECAQRVLCLSAVYLLAGVVGVIRLRQSVDFVITATALVGLFIDIGRWKAVKEGACKGDKCTRKDKRNKAEKYRRKKGGK